MCPSMNKLLTVPPQCSSRNISTRGNRPMTAINPAMDDGAIARMPRRFDQLNRLHWKADLSGIRRHNALGRQAPKHRINPLWRRHSATVEPPGHHGHESANYVLGGEFARAASTIRRHATISNCYSKQRLQQPPNVGSRRSSGWKSLDFRSLFKNLSDIFQLFERLRLLGNFYVEMAFASLMRVLFKPFGGGYEPNRHDGSKVNLGPIKNQSGCGQAQSLLCVLDD
jgi:hypothetical protein